MNLHPYNFEILSRQREQELRSRASNAWKTSSLVSSMRLKDKILSRFGSRRIKQQQTPACCS